MKNVRKKIILYLIILTAGLFMICRLIWIPGWDRNDRILAEKKHWEQKAALIEDDDKKVKMEDLPRLIEQYCRSFTGNGINIVEVKMEGRDSEAGKVYLNMRWQGSWSGIIQGLAKLEEEGARVRVVNLNVSGGEGRFEIGIDQNEIK